jgi:hypothetical protein
VRTHVAALCELQVVTRESTFPTERDSARRMQRGSTFSKFKFIASRSRGVTCAQSLTCIREFWPVSGEESKMTRSGRRTPLKTQIRMSRLALDRFHWPSAIYALFSVIRSPPFGPRRKMNGREPLRRALWLPDIYGKSTTRVTRPRTKMPTNNNARTIACFGFGVVINSDYRCCCAREFSCCVISSKPRCASDYLS